MQQVVVADIGDVVGVELHIDPRTHRILHHRLQRVVARRDLDQTGGAVRCGTGDAAADVLQAAANLEAVPRQVISVPQAERVLRCVLVAGRRLPAR